MTHAQISKRRRSHTPHTSALTVVVAVVIILSMLSPLFSAWQIKANYDLSAAKTLLGSTPKYLRDKLKYDMRSNSWQFNETAASLPTESGQSVSVGDVTYSAKLPGDILTSDGLTLTDTKSKLDIKLKPQFAVSTGQEQDGHVVYPLIGSKSQLVYSFKNNGVKEDIVLYQSPGDTAEFSYSMHLPTGLEARIQKDGSVGIFGGDPTLFSDISYGSDKDRALVDKARENSDKTHLYYEIPAPIVNGNNLGDVKATFTIDGDKLTVKVSGLAGAHYPLSIDPSFVMNTSGCAWQSSGNNEDNISFSGCQISRQGLSGGAVGTWNTTSPMVTDYYGTEAVVYNGYLYVLGGRIDSSGGAIEGVEYAQINQANGTVGALHFTHNSTDDGTTYVSGYSSVHDNDFEAVAYNGYLYVVGGVNGSTVTNTIQYAPLNTNGTVGAWQTASNNMNTARSLFGLEVSNGYLYAVAGCTSYNVGLACTGYSQTVESAPIRANGNLGTWSVSGNNLTTTRFRLASAVYNGRIYALGGCVSNSAGTENCSGGHLASVESAALGTGGTVGTWSVINSFTTARSSLNAAAYNGYIYIFGGAAGATLYSDVQTAKIYANGKLGPWQTTTALAGTRKEMGVVAYNGYIYTAGGCSSSGSNCGGSGGIAEVRYSQISTTLGNTGSYTGTSTYNAAGIMSYAALATGGYIYLIGGTTIASGGDSGQLNTARYAAINSDGTLGTWNTTSANYTNLRDAGAGGVGCSSTECKGRLNTAAGAYNGYIYIAGGVSNGTGYWWGDIQSAIQCTGVNAPVSGCTGAGDLRGTSGGATWTTQLKDFITNSATTYSNTNGRAQMGMQIYNGYMYLVGGDNTSVDSSNIYYAPLTTSGGVGTFATTTSLPSARAGVRTFVANGRFYVVGGGVGAGWSNVSNDNDDVLFTTINTATGALSGTCPSGYTCLSGTSWVDANASANGGSGSSFVAGGTGLSEYGVAISNGYLYISGGQNGNGATATYSAVYKAKINANGSLSSWSTIASMGNNRYGHGYLVANGFIYSIGGCSNKNVLGGVNCNSTTQMLNDYQTAQIYNGGGGIAGTSGTTTALSSGLKGVGAAAANGYVYRIGGANSSGTAQTSVDYAQADPSGTLSASWASTATLNTARYDAAVTIYSGYVYVLGGNDGSSVLGTGEYAKINSDGTLGTWTQFTMADNREAAAVFAYNGYLYIAGGTGNGTTGLSTVKYASITSTGAPGSWSSTTAGFTNARYGLVGFSSSNGSVYVMGGYDGTNYYSDVQYAVPTGSGDITSWTYGPSFPFARSRFSAVISNGYVYIYSGKDSSGARSDIQYAPIMSNGSLDYWNYGGTISGTAEYWGGSACAGGFLYLIGGSPDGTNTTTTVNYAPLQVTPNVAHYSLVLTTDMRTLPVNYFTSLALQSAAGSTISTKLSLATATTAFTSVAGDYSIQGGVKYPFTTTTSDGGSAYSLMITLDDSVSFYFGESSTAGSSLSYLKLNYHANPAMRLRGGKTFNSNQLQSLDAP